MPRALKIAYVLYLLCVGLFLWTVWLFLNLHFKDPYVWGFLLIPPIGLLLRFRLAWDLFQACLLFILAFGFVFEGTARLEQLRWPICLLSVAATIALNFTSVREYLQLSAPRIVSRSASYFLLGVTGIAILAAASFRLVMGIQNDHQKLEIAGAGVLLLLTWGVMKSYRWAIVLYFVVGSLAFFSLSYWVIVVEYFLPTDTGSFHGRLPLEAILSAIAALLIYLSLFRLSFEKLRSLSWSDRSDRWKILLLEGYRRWVIIAFFLMMALVVVSRQPVIGVKRPSWFNQ